MDILDRSSTVKGINGERAVVIRRSDNLTVGGGSMDLETTSRSQQQRTQSSIIQQRNQHSSSLTTRNKQTSSQIILGDDLGDARFDRRTSGRRTTVETRNLPNGHLLQEKSIESSVRQSAETRTAENRAVEQKVLSESMSAKSSMNQSVVLNNVHSTSQANQLRALESNSVNQVSTTGASQQMTQAQTQHQLQANKKGTVEVSVTREVTVTKKTGEASGDSTFTSSSIKKSPIQGALHATVIHQSTDSSQQTSSKQDSSTKLSSSHQSRQEMSSSSNEAKNYSSSSQSRDGTTSSGLINGHPLRSPTVHASTRVSSDMNGKAVVSESKSSSATTKNETRRQQESSSASTHSRIVQGTGFGGKEWTSRDEAVGKSSFASNLRESSGIGMHSSSRSRIETIPTHSSVEVIETSQRDGYCPIHNPSHQTQIHSSRSHQVRSGGGSTSQSRLTSAEAYSHNQHQQSITNRRTDSKIHEQSDNLRLSKGKFDGETSSRSSYGGHYQMADRVVPVRSTHQSSISLGSYNLGTSGGGGSSYKKEFTRQEIKPCPASLLETSKSPYKYQRQSSSHRFYMPTVSD